MYAGYVVSLNREVAALEARIDYLQRIGDFGCANDASGLLSGSVAAIARRAALPALDPAQVCSDVIPDYREVRQHVGG